MLCKLACPSQSETLRTSRVASSMCIAQLWRSTCGEMRFFGKISHENSASLLHLFGGLGENNLPHTMQILTIDDSWTLLRRCCCTLFVHRAFFQGRLTATAVPAEEYGRAAHGQNHCERPIQDTSQPRDRWHSAHSAISVIVHSVSSICRPSK